jgi:hypothetical protein
MMVTEKKEGPSAFEVVKVTMVANWSWKTGDGRCPICHASITVPCLTCANNPTQSGCHIAWGICGHNVHHHCVEGWNKTNPNCPQCNHLWKAVRYHKIEEEKVEE